MSPNAPTCSERAPLPASRGPITEHLFRALRFGTAVPPLPQRLSGDPFDEDEQLALYTLFELSYGGFADVPYGMEEEFSVHRLRERLGRAFEAWLSRHAPPRAVALGARAAVTQAIDGIASSGAAALAADPNAEAMLRLIRYKASYHLKEADPHTWLIPRLRHPEVRGWLLAVQAGEYGIGHGDTHARLYAKAMEDLGLDITPNAYLEETPAIWLALSNVMSWGASRTRLAWWSLGQLAVMEMDSVAPSRLLERAAKSLELPDSVGWFHRIHVLADGEHEQWMAEALDAVPDAHTVSVAEGAAAIAWVYDALGRQVEEWLADPNETSAALASVS